MNNVMRKRYSNDFRKRAVALVSLGRTVPEVARELGIGTSILYRWTLSQRQAQEQGSQLRRLRKEKARLLLENDILKKAVAILGAQPQNKPAR